MAQLTLTMGRPRMAGHAGYRNFWTVAGIVVLGLVAVMTTVFAVQWPFTKSGMIRRLERASSMEVEIRGFRSTYFPPGCVAENVVFRKMNERAGEPIAVARTLRIESSYSGLIARTKRIEKIETSGVKIHLPPEGAVVRRQRGSSGQSLLIKSFRIQDAVLELASKHPQARPLRFAIHDARFSNLSPGNTIPFSLALMVPLPPGEVHARGWIGPWRDDHGSVRSTPVSGSCTYERGNLGAFKSLAGEISARVNFSGTLEKLQISGNTTAPDFEVRESGHRFPLTTDFEGSVDLVTGDVTLPRLNAKLGETTMRANARIAGRPKTVELNVSQGRGRLQDLVLLFSDAPRSPMNGPIRFRTSVVLPAQRRPFIERVRLRGAFEVEPAKFAASNTRARVDELSQRASGDKDKAPPTAGQVLSKLEGRVLLAGGVARFEHISFAVPGAAADMRGTYSFLSKQVNLYGKMRMQATVSEATKGAKSLLLKILDPFFKKKNAGAEVPVAMTGKYPHTHFSAGLKK